MGQAKQKGYYLPKKIVTDDVVTEDEDEAGNDVAEEVTTNSDVTAGIEKKTLLSIMRVVVENAGIKGVKLRDLPRAVDTVIKTWPNLQERKNLLTNKTDILDEIVGQNFLTSKQDIFNYEDDLVTTA